MQRGVFWGVRGASHALPCKRGMMDSKSGKTCSACPNQQERSMSRAINMSNINPKIVKLEYAVRGPLVARALEIKNELEKGAKKPFERVINANIGDAHAMGQRPITFTRQVVACVAYPEVMNQGDFPEDVKERANALLNACGGRSVGSYSSSYGIEIIRKDVAAYIQRRDGQPCDWNNVCLTAGASLGIKSILQLLINTIGGKTTGVMIPIPQYPLYSAALAEFGLEPVRYFLEEERNWALNEAELSRSFDEGSKNLAVRGLVVINPGNPTGQVLTRENVETVIKFAHQKKLLVFADEVYQDNIYAEGSAFHSFKKVMTEMGPPYSKELELASFMSVSKGYMGECGLRGGWMELVNMHPEVQANLYKALSAMLCPTTLGQTAVDCTANPPKEGEPSYDLWLQEKTGILESLATRAKVIADSFNAMDGFKCNTVQGAMYAFPRFELSQKAIEMAKREKRAPDVYYAFRLLEATGICIIAGTGFGQKPGTFHFRTTILPQPDMLQEMLDSFRDFHAKFTKEHA